MNQGVTGRLISLSTLPDDILFLLLSYLDVQGIGRFSRCCKRLHKLCGQDCIWSRWKKSMLIVKSPSKGEYWLPIQEQCRLSNNWTKGHCLQFRQIQHRIKQLPWMQFDGTKLWISFNNKVHCYQQKPNGHLQEKPGLVLSGHSQDISRFKCKQGLVVSGSSEASICTYSAETGRLLFKLENCHSSHIQDVDFHNTCIVSGSRDGYIKIWNMDNLRGGALKCDIPMEERVWSLGINPAGDSFATGTPGIKTNCPLKIWDIETAQELVSLGRDYRFGSSVLDLYYESPTVLFSCGHDTIVRMWDLRLPPDKCALSWEEPFDSTVYTVRSDGGHSVLAGTALHGLVHLWDKRQTQEVQKYYVGKSHNSSPVYSLAFDSHYMYVALDKEVTLVDFSMHYVLKK